MKKLMSIMLALALTIGVAGVTMAQDTSKDSKTTTKKKSTKKKGDAKADTKTGDAKTAKKGKKGKDADPATK
jgi:uncharacterized protein YxeA